jgi:hypothetical protein
MVGVPARVVTKVEKTLGTGDIWKSANTQFVIRNVYYELDISADSSDFGTNTSLRKSINFSLLKVR